MVIDFGPNLFQPVLTSAFESEPTSMGDWKCSFIVSFLLQVIAGGIDNVVKIWDLRKDSIVYRMHGHQDTITGMSLSHEGGLLLTNSMDGSLRVWDVRPFAPQERCVAVYQVMNLNFPPYIIVTSCA